MKPEKQQITGKNRKCGVGVVACNSRFGRMVRVVRLHIDCTVTNCTSLLPLLDTLYEIANRL